MQLARGGPIQLATGGPIYLARTRSSGPMQLAGDTAGPEALCEHDDAIDADLDGDGAKDQVVHAVGDDGPVLAVCSSVHGYQELTSSGSADLLEVADVDDDGRPEILYGTTEGGIRFWQVAVVTPDGLRPVVFHDTIDREVPFDGEPLAFTTGYPDGTTTGDGLWGFGCAAPTDGPRVLRAIRVVYDSSLTWRHWTQVTDFELDGAAARIYRDDGDYYTYDSPVDPPSDLLDDPEGLLSYVVAERTSEC